MREKGAGRNGFVQEFGDLGDFKQGGAAIVGKNPIMQLTSQELFYQEQG